MRDRTSYDYGPALCYFYSMSSSSPLRLKALATELDRPWTPQLEQVKMLIMGLSHICQLRKPQNLPDKPFVIEPCPESSIEDVDEGVKKDGIDFFGLYSIAEKAETTVTLFMCRIRQFAGRYGFHFQDVVTIVLIHELAHFVTHCGRSKDRDCWAEFFGEKSRTEDVEGKAQQATHLYLRTAKYGNLVQVFDRFSNHCPPDYRRWRCEWEKQIRIHASEPKDSRNYLQPVLEAFRNDLAAKRRKHATAERNEIHDRIGYDE